MPSSGIEYERRVTYHDNAGYTHDESAASILQSVKEQEAQFEALTRELEAERQSVANQLERCKIGSETASISSISSTDESFRWHGPQSQTQDSHLDEGSDNESKTSGSALVDSCLRVLQERGLMNQGYDEDPMDPHYDDRLPPNGNHYNTSYSMNGPTSYDRNLESPSESINSQQRSQASLSKVVTSRQVQRSGTGNGSVSSDNYASYSSLKHGPSEDDSRNYEENNRYGTDPVQDDRGNYSNYPNTSNNYANDPYPDNGPDGYDERLPYEDEYIQPRDGYQPSDRYNDSSFYSNPPGDQDRYRVDPDHYQDDRYNEPPPAGYYREEPSAEIGYRGVPPEDRYDPRPVEERYSPANQPEYRNPPPTMNEYPDGDPSGGQRSPGMGSDRYGGPPGYNNEVPLSYENLDDSQQPPDRYVDSPGGRYDDDPRRFEPDQPQQEDNPRRYDQDPTRSHEGPGPFGTDPQGRFGGPAHYEDEPENYPNEPPHFEDDRYPSDNYPSAPFEDERHPSNNYLSENPPHEAERFPSNNYLSENQPNYDDDRYPSNDPYGRRSPSTDSVGNGGESRWRNPDLPEVIEFLGHPNDAVKANAAAYLQHLTFNDDPIKAKTRGLGGIHALVELVNNDIPEVHRNACGALRNLSYGKTNDANKQAIKNASGIPALVRLLRKTRDNDVRELVTGVLWNLSSCKDLKKSIIDDALTVLVNTVIIPHSGWDLDMEDEKPRDVYWSTVFRNASGVLRNISSDGDYARKKLRECEGLVDSLLTLVKAAIGKNDIDNKSVENCVCILRNLSFRMQEVDDPDFHKRRTLSREQPDTENVGCFGGNKKKTQSQNPPPPSGMGYQRSRGGPIKGMELLWQPEIVHVYLPLLSDCSNPETLEAAAGSIQNLAACDWQPAIDLRAAVRKEKGLPIIVELLGIEADRVVCASAIALKNLSLDQRNKELIGKYAMKQLVMKLPREDAHTEFPTSDATIAAVISTLHEVIRKNVDFAQSLFNEGGINRLMHITKSKNKYSAQVVKNAATLLYAMWNMKELHGEYKRQGWKETHFVTKTMAAKASTGSPSVSANNTLNRPRSDQSRGTEGYRDSTLPPVYRQNPQYRDDRLAQPSPDMGRQNPQYRDDRMAQPSPDTGRYNASRNGKRPEDVPMADLNTSAGYATIDSRGGRDDYNRGGAPYNYGNTQPPQPQSDSKEPLYAQVNKNSKRRQEGYLDGHGNYSMQNASGYSLDQTGNPAGADSWV